MRKKNSLFLEIPIFVIISISFLLFSTSIPPVKAAVPALDSSANTSVDYSFTSFSLPSFSTSYSSYEMIYVSVVSYNQYVTGISDSHSLSWTCRQSSGNTISFGSGKYLSTWWTRWSSSGSTTITVTMSGAGFSAAAVAFGISNVVTIGSPFDVSYVSATGSSTSVSSGSKSVSSTNDFVIGAVGVQNAPTLTKASSYTSIATGSLSTGSNPLETAAEYYVTSSATTATYSLSSSNNWAIVADAVMASPVSITFTTNGVSSDVGTSTNILTIDSTPYSYSQLQGPQSFNWVTGTTHTVTAASPIFVGSDKQYVFSSWTNPNGLLGVGPSTFTTPTSNTAVTSNYNAQYHLTVTSAYGSPTPSVGTSWQTAGSVTASVSSPVTVGGIAYQCTGWTGTGSVVSSGTTATTTFTINAPSTITWNWQPVSESITLARPSGISSDASGTILTVDSVDYTYSTLPHSFTWSSGSTHQVTATSPISAGSGKHYVFSSWTNPYGLSGVGPSTFTTPASTATVTANYGTEYQLTVTSPHGSPSPSVGTNWQAAGVVTASVSSPVTENGIMYQCTGWTGTGSVTSGSGTTTTFTISAVSSITWNWQTVPVPITIATSGLSSDAQGTILTIDGTPYTYPAVPTLDGSNTGFKSSGGGSFTLSLTTSKPNDLLYVAIASTDCYVNSVTSTLNSLTWSCRQASGNTISFGSNYARYLSTWYAIQPSTGPTTITVTLSGSSSQDSASVLAFAVSGVDISSPFDGNAVNAKDSSGGTSASVTINTHGTNEFVIGSVGIRAGTPPLTSGSGFNIIGTISSGGSYLNEVSTESAIASGPQTNLAVGYSWSTSYAWGIVADALKAATTTFDWIPGSTHTISASEIISAGTGKQYNLLGWSDPTDFSDTIFTVPSSSITATVNYQTKYNFVVSSSHGGPTGQNWYTDGATVSSTVTTPISGGQGIQYVTTGWTGTGSLSSGGSAGSTTTGSFTIHAYTTCTWNWKTQYQVNFEVSGSGTITSPLAGSGFYDSGSLLIAAQATIGYTFSHWSSDSGSITFAGSTSSTTTATIGATGTITATFTQNSYTVGVTVNPSSSAGSITGYVTTQTYHYGDLVTLTETPNNGYTFSGWSGDGSGTGTTCGITVTKNMAVIAGFTQDQYTLNVHASGDGCSVTKNPDHATYTYGTTVALTPHAADGWTFSEWSSNVIGGSVTVNSNTEVTATFTQDQYILTVNVNAAGCSVTKDPSQTTYAYGTVVGLTPVAANGWTFSGFTGDTTTGSISMTGSKTVTATFTQNEYTIGITVNPSSSAGTVTPDKLTPYHYGDLVTFTASANSGYAFSAWSGAGTTTVEGKRQITITENTAVIADFQAQVMSTWVSVSCSQEKVDKSGSMQTTVSGKLTLSTDHNMGVAGKTVSLQYYDGATWQDVTNEQINTGSDGSYSYVWTVPDSISVGPHVVKVVFAGDQIGTVPQYIGIQAETNGNEHGGGLFVIPEYLMGALAALAACFVGFVAFQKRSSLKHLKRIK